MIDRAGIDRARSRLRALVCAVDAYARSEARQALADHAEGDVETLLEAVDELEAALHGGLSAGIDVEKPAVKESQRAANKSAAELEGAVLAVANEAVGRLRSKLEATQLAVHMVAEDMVIAVEARRKALEGPRGGQHVQHFGELAGAPPSVFRPIEWWARRLDEISRGSGLVEMTLARMAALDAILSGDGLTSRAVDQTRGVAREAVSIDGGHEWMQRRGEGLTACRLCGVVRRGDGQNKPCRGRVRVMLRDRSGADE